MPEPLSSNSLNARTGQFCEVVDRGFGELRTRLVHSFVHLSKSGNAKDLDEIIHRHVDAHTPLSTPRSARSGPRIETRNSNVRVGADSRSVFPELDGECKDDGPLFTHQTSSKTNATSGTTSGASDSPTYVATASPKTVPSKIPEENEDEDGNEMVVQSVVPLETAIDRWAHLFSALTSKPKLLVSQTFINYQVHECWAIYLSMLRRNESHCRTDYSHAMSRVLSGRQGKRRQSLVRTNSIDSYVGNLSRAIKCMLDPATMVLHPDSRIRQTWVIFSAFVLLYDTVIIPINAFFEWGEERFFEIVMWISSIFWVFDIFATFMSGRYINGELEMKPAVVAKIYAKTWLPFDVSLVVLDWTLILVEVVTGKESMNQVGAAAIRSVRIIRLIRLLRLGKLQMILRDVLSVNNRGVILFAGVIKTTLAYAIYFHLLACVWYGIGCVQDDGWGTRCEASSTVAHCYFSAAHWALSQIHGTTATEYNTTLEWGFATLAMFIGWILFALFLGRTGDAVAQFSGADKVEMRQHCVQYSKTHKLSSSLAYRLLRFVDAYDLQADLGQRVRQEREILTMLPMPLQAEILVETRKPFLTSTAIMNDLDYVSSKIVKQLCSDATSSLTCLNGDVVFSAGENGAYWRIIDCGYLVYIDRAERKSADFTSRLTAALLDAARSEAAAGQEDMGKAVFRMQNRSTAESGGHRPNMGATSWECLVGEVAHGSAKALKKGQYVSEMVLWTPWVHCGDLLVTSDSVLLQLSLDAFCHVLKVRIDTCLMVARYAHAYVKQISSVNGGASDIYEYHPEEDENEEFTDINHTIFLSHYKAEAGTEATLMQEALKMLLERAGVPIQSESAVFLDSEDLTDLTTLKDHVINSKNVVVLLTPDIFTRPWCLVEVVTAMKNKVQMVPVEIQRPGLKFVYPDDNFYAKLRNGRILSEQDKVMLENEGIMLSDIEIAMKSVLKQIALPFSPHKSKGVREAELMDIVNRCLGKVEKERKSLKRLHTQPSDVGTNSSNFNRFRQAGTANFSVASVE